MTHATTNSCGRLAPSPTGLLHLGHAFSLLIAWWSARSQQGRVVLRVDDIDIARSDDAHVEALLYDLRWLGLDWDGAVQVASHEKPRILAAAQALIDAGLAYPCVCTRGEIQRALGAPQAGVTETRYPGTCSGRYSSLEQAEALSGREAGLRFRCPKHTSTTFVDQVYGTHQGCVNEQTGDFLILRRNKMPAYQLGVVVGDWLDGVSEVVRGRDLLDSTLRQILLQEALGYQSPSYLHVPLVCDHTGRRLAKRSNDLSLAELRERGVSAQQIIRWAANCAGQLESQALEHPRDLLHRFAPARIPTKDILLPERTESMFAAS